MDLKNYYSNKKVNNTSFIQIRPQPTKISMFKAVNIKPFANYFPKY